MLDRLIHAHPDDHPLAGVSLFAGCTADELRAIVAVTTLIDVPARRVLCHEGERGDECFVIVDGTAVATVAGDPVAMVGPGDFFGEMALLDGGPRIATVTTSTPARLLVLTRPEFNALLERVPAVCHRILTGVGHRLRQPTCRATQLVGA